VDIIGAWTTRTIVLEGEYIMSDEMALANGRGA
jgi:hypothetical protein